MTTSWQKGDRIQDRWEIHEILRGGMGIVYVVYDHELRSAFAAKTFQDEIFAFNPSVADRFRQEALTWVNLDTHQNITEARFVKKIEGKPYLFLEYVSGGDLGGWVNTPRLTEDLPQVLRFAIQICDGMGHALAKGITAHRDIKPANCLVTPDGTVKVTDFGLAKIFDDIDAAEVGETHTRSLCIKLSQTGAAAGTCTHMAPEQFADAKHVDVRADIYSFGVLLYEMISGRLPFVGGSWSEMRQLHRSQSAPTLSGRSAEFDRIVRRCLEKEPGRRYSGFGEVRDELAAVFEQMTGGVAPEAARGDALNVVSWSNKGVSLGALGQHEEALTCFARALAIDASYVPAWVNLGNAQSRSGRHEEALASFERAIEINPRLEQVWINKGGVLNRLKQDEEALTCFEHVIGINRRNKKAWHNKGLTLNRLGRHEEALTCFDQILTHENRDEEAWYNKGVALNDLGRHEEALTCYDRAIVLNQCSEKAWYNKGRTLNSLGRHEEALACYDRLLEINPCYESAQSNKGATLIDLGRPLDALTFYDGVLALNPHSGVAWYNRGYTLYRLEHHEEALACYDRALALDPRDGKAWFNKGGVLVRNFKRYSEALACFEEAQRLGISQAVSQIALCRRMLGW